jgi:adenylate kinase
VRILVLLGAPGSGKGTQAPILSRLLGLPVLASGDVLRAAVAADSSLGRDAETYMSRGELVPDDTIVEVFLERLAEPDAANGAILDGFPRTRPQAEALDAALARRGARVDRALYIDVPVDELVDRMAGRRICAESGHVFNMISKPPRVDSVCDVDGSPLIQREDDREETVRARMALQIPPLEEVLDHYRRKGVLTAVDGRGDIEDVTAALIEALSTPARSA